MIEVSEDRVHRILGNKESNDFYCFMDFLENIYCLENTVPREELNKFIIVWNNCSIHKRMKVKDFIKEAMIRILTIWPYCLNLNPAEKMILYI